MNDVCWKIKKIHAKTLAAPDESQMRFGALSENWPISPHLEQRNSRGEMECIKQTMETAGSRALLSSESVPVLMMLIQGKNGGRRAKKWEAGEDGGGPTLEGACVRRIPKLKHTKRLYARGLEQRTKNTLTSCHKHSVIWYSCTSWYGEVPTRTDWQKNVMKFM